MNLNTKECDGRVHGTEYKTGANSSKLIKEMDFMDDYEKNCNSLDKFVSSFGLFSLQKILT